MSEQCPSQQLPTYTPKSTMVSMKRKKAINAGILTFLAAVVLLTTSGNHILTAKNERVRLRQARRKLSFFDPKTVMHKSLHMYNANNLYAGQDTTNAPVPKILHHVVLGANPPPSMLKLVEWNARTLHDQYGFQTKIWRDADIEQLVHNFGCPRLQQSWEYAKADTTKSRTARLADFARPLIMYVEGGVYLDADIIPCTGLEYMVDTPGVVSFSMKLPDDQVNGAAMSAPPRHRLMGLALENFIAKGPDIGTLNNLGAAGPHAFAEIVDLYLKEVGVDTPPLSEGYNVYTDPSNWSGLPRIHSFWAAKLADLRFMNGEGHVTQTWHMHFGTWIKSVPDRVRPCDSDTDLVWPWIDAFCRNGNGHGPMDDRGGGCFGDPI
ncbi:hypothetical protein HJC23_012545 [Cyclotella cryptica]|uniref:Glycosyltransferase family 32 protein n=1 Tax=Cyclotella cryptica TaxID=29204 RepID=A0ABD3QU20_9STRA|eukprot:CCRYP_003200-RA/>CCRYP_003200-RA protein AED:0.11 eAED:0.11 QI:0/-1/0/1/-1/1/1/0/378